VSDKSPFGETFYRNYDPDLINTVGDAIAFFRWLSERNADKGEPVASQVYEDCAQLLETEVFDS